MLAVTDTRNGAPPNGLQPLALFLVLFGIGMAFGAQTGLFPSSFLPINEIKWLTT